jgi:hypothetical protein
MEIRTLVCGGVLGVEAANPLDKGLHASLLEESHKGRSESLSGIGGNLGNSGLVGGTLLDVAASDLLELKVSCNIGRDENVGQLAGGHKELGDEIDVPVVEAAILLPGLLTLTEVSVLLEELYSELDISVQEVGRFQIGW